jgi:hypothetical protein
MRNISGAVLTAAPAKPFGDSMIQAHETHIFDKYDQNPLAGASQPHESSSAKHQTPSMHGITGNPVLINVLCNNSSATLLLGNNNQAVVGPVP